MDYGLVQQFIMLTHLIFKKMSPKMISNKCVEPKLTHRLTLDRENLCVR